MQGERWILGTLENPRPVVLFQSAYFRPRYRMGISFSRLMRSISLSILALSTTKSINLFESV